MKITAIGSMLLGIGVFVLMVAPCVSAQTIPEMLNGQWFQVKGSHKGYADYGLDEITSKVSHQQPGLYIYTTYDVALSEFTMTTCTQAAGSSAYTSHPVPHISIDNIFGDSYQKQVWDFHRVLSDAGAFLRFDRSPNFFDVIPFLVMSVKLDKNNDFKSASFTTEGCISYLRNGYTYSVGSCKLSGKTVDASKVPDEAIAACGP